MSAAIRRAPRPSRPRHFCNAGIHRRSLYRRLPARRSLYRRLPAGQQFVPPATLFKKRPDTLVLATEVVTKWLATDVFRESPASCRPAAGDPQCRRGRRRSTGSHLGFFHNFIRFLVVSKRNKFRVSQMIPFGPLNKLDLAHNFGLHPDTLFHFLFW